MPRDHALFRRHPLDGQVNVAGEVLPTPYHVYDGTMLFFGGTADGAVAAELLRNENLVPLLDDRGRALTAIWICDFADASLGPHHELQISLFASKRPMPPLASHPFAIFRALTAMPEARMVCHGLWNNTERVLRYNAEHLRLAARLCASDMQRAGDRWRFRFADQAGNTILAGEAPVVGRPSAALSWRLARHVGFIGLIRMLRSPFIHIPVVNTRSERAPENLVADTYSQAARQAIRYAGPEDHLIFGPSPYAPLGFSPDFVQQNDGLAFVYHRPRRDD